MCEYIESAPILAFMYLPYSMIDVLKQHIVEQQRQYSQIKEQFEQTQRDLDDKAKAGDRDFLTSQYINQSNQLLKLKNRKGSLQRCSLS